MGIGSYSSHCRGQAGAGGPPSRRPRRRRRRPRAGRRSSATCSLLDTMRLLARAGCAFPHLVVQRREGVLGGAPTARGDVASPVVRGSDLLGRTARRVPSGQLEVTVALRQLVQHLLPMRTRRLPATKHPSTSQVQGNIFPPNPGPFAHRCTTGMGEWQDCALLSTSRGVTVGESIFATLHTNAGPIRIELFPNHAPKTVANFVGLAEGTQAVHRSAHRRPGVGPVLRRRDLPPRHRQLHDPGR